MPNFLNTPLVPKSATQPAEDYLTEPHLDQSPGMASLKGFGAGALEGLRGLTSPAQLAGIAGMLIPGGGIPAAARGAASLAEEAPAATSAAASWAAKLAEAGRGAQPQISGALQGLARGLPEAAEAVPAMGRGAWAAPKAAATDWGAELQGARDFVGRMGGIPNEMSAGRMYSTPPSSLELPMAGLASEAGKINPEMAVGAGALGAAGAYAYPKVKQALDELKGFGQQVVQPFQDLGSTLRGRR